LNLCGSPRRITNRKESGAISLFGAMVYYCRFLIREIPVRVKRSKAKCTTASEDCGEHFYRQGRMIPRQCGFFCVTKIASGWCKVLKALYAFNLTVT
jgi:hypothetical protein